MKILIIEDNDRKYDSTVRYIKRYLLENEVEFTIERVETINSAKISLSENQFTHVVIDMMFPRREGERIINNAGIEILSYINRKMSNVRYTFNSSTEEGKAYLRDAGYEDEPYIVNSSIYNLQEEFNNFLSGEKGEHE